LKREAYYTIQMTRKGLLAEILSKARHYDDCENYRVGYRDYEQILEVSLSEFLELSENFEKIPAGRIYFVKRNGLYLYQSQNYMKMLSSLSEHEQ
jgi:hypothetical protein